MAYGSYSYGSVAWGGGIGAASTPIPPIPTPDEELHEVDEIQVRATLEAWQMLIKMGLQDSTVAAASTVEEIEAVVSGLMGHAEYVRLAERTRLMLRRAEIMGILTDDDIANATTTAEITAILVALNGGVDPDIYSAFYQGT